MIRIDKIMLSPLFRDYMGRIAAKEIARKFCCHDLHHLVDTARITYILVLENNYSEELKKDIVYGAALLHDIGRWREYETGEDHAVVGAQLAMPILKEAGYNNKEIELICKGILEHRNLPQKPSTLGYYLYKGDKLSRPCFSCQARSECYKIDKMEIKDKILTY